MITLVKNTPPPPDYLDMDLQEMLQTMGIDGMKWANAFMECWSQRLAQVDHNLMLSWFCNAIMAGYDEAMRRKEPQ